MATATTSARGAVAVSKGEGALVVAAYELASFCESKGAKVHALHIGGSRQFSFGRVKLVPPFHCGAVQGGDGPATTAPAGVVLTMAGTTVYHTGDTALTMEMKLL